MSQANKLEKSLFQIKLDLSKISEERWHAALSRNQNEVTMARVKAAEKTLENCNTLAKYVANFSTPLARQITEREEEARRTFEKVRRTRDPELLHEWIKEQLIPSTRFAERLGHMAASASKFRETGTDFHRWAESR
ncbi:MAG: hypothetical protein ACRECH_05330 [Nitrososphaerales archaeon]